MTPRRALALAAGFALLAPATAAASQQAPRDAFTTEVHTAEAVARTCAARALGPGADGAARVTWAAPAGGLAEVRLRGAARRGDWDLAVFEPGGGEAAGASTSFGS